MTLSSTLSNCILKLEWWEWWGLYHVPGEGIPVNYWPRCKKCLSSIKVNGLGVRSKGTSEWPIKGYTVDCYVETHVCVSPSVFLCEGGRQKPLCSLEQKSPGFLGCSLDFGWVLSFQASDRTQPSYWTPVSNLGEAIAFLSSSQLYLAPLHVIEWRFGYVGSVVSRRWKSANENYCSTKKNDYWVSADIDILDWQRPWSCKTLSRTTAESTVRNPVGTRGGRRL